GEDTAVILRQDNYYLDLGGVNPGDPLPNFDHPSAFDWDLFQAHLQHLSNGHTINVPHYDFATHRRTQRTTRLEPRPIILVEGILILGQAGLLPAFDYKFFIECDSDTRLERRLKRDVAERGRTRQSVITQFTTQVAPMHDAFVEPSKANADVVITQDQCSLETIRETGPVIQTCRLLLAR
ncbi:MAG TPA: uridine kinase, partial [Hellea balneolensis]|nr:uridine kinase [Hellea balneolensis]